MWHKSSYSQASDCIEVHDGILVRDSRQGDGPVLKFTPLAWARFAGKLKEES